jgi:gliding motility-associated-like protein
MRKGLVLLLFIFSSLMVYGQKTKTNKQHHSSARIQRTQDPGYSITTTRPKSFCQGDSVVLTASGAPASSTFQWTNTGTDILNATNQSYTAYSSGNYSVVVTSSSGTIHYDTVLVTVYPKPIPTFTFNNDNECSGTDIQFSSNVSSGTAPFSYSWNFNDGSANSTSQNPVHAFTTLGCGTVTYNVILTITDTNGCSQTVSHIVTVKQKPDVVITDQNNPFTPFSNCSHSPTISNPNFLVKLGNTGSSSCITSYTVNWGDGVTQTGLTSSSFPVSHTYTQLGQFVLTVTATSSNGCITIKTYTLTNQSNPAVGISGPGSTSGCAPIGFWFKLSQFELNSPGTTYTWNFGDGTPDTVWTTPQAPVVMQDSIFHVFTNSSCGQSGNQYTVKVTAKNGCDSTTATVNNIKVFKKPVAGYSIPASACINRLITFNNTSDGAYNPSGPTCNRNTIYEWDFGDGGTSTSFSPTHSYSATGTYSVRLVAQGACGNDTVIKSICITGNPSSSFTINNSIICKGATVTATNTSGSLSDCIAATYLWSVTYSASNCGSTLSWTFSPGSTSSSINPSFIFINPGTYTIQLTVTNPCSSISSTKTVTVKAPPSVSISSISNACTSTIINPSAAVTNCGTGSLTYSWGFPGGSPSNSTSQSPGSVIYNTAGTYTIYDTVTNECGFTPASTTFTVNPVPVITVPADITVCAGAQVGPLNFTSNPAGSTYSWTNSNTSIGFSSASGTANPISAFTSANSTVNQQTATINVSGTKSGCTGSNSFLIKVNPKPSVSGSTQSICTGGSFTYTPTSTSIPAGTTYSWPAPPVTGGMTGGASGTNQTSITGSLVNNTNSNQTATYTVTPVTDPTLGSCSGAPFTISITVKPTPSIRDTVLTVCSGSAFTLALTNGSGNVVPSSINYTWSAPSVPVGINGVASGTNQSSFNGTLTNSTNAVQTVIYTISTSANSCPGNSFTVTVNVKPAPVVPVQRLTVCSGATFTNTITDGDPSTTIPSGTTYTWNAPTVTGGLTGGAPGIATATISGTLNNPTTSAQTATYLITPTANGCSGTAFNLIVTVNPKPVVSNLTATICTGNSFTTTPPNVPAGTTYTWTNPSSNPTGVVSGGSAQPTGQTSVSQLLTNNTNASADLVYTITPQSGICVGTDFLLTVTVKPTPVAANQTAAICSGGGINISPSGVPSGTTYSWNNPSVTPASAITDWSAQNSQTSITQGSLTNTTNAVATIIYTVTPSVNSCSGSTFTVTVTVNPKPVIPDQAANICSNTSFSINPANGVPNTSTIVPAGTMYTWSNPVSATAGAISGGSAETTGLSSISQTLINNTNASATLTYRVRPLSGAAGSCAGDSFSVVVTVNPQPGISDQAKTICSGSSFTATPSGAPAGTTYTWSAPVSNPASANSGGTAQTNSSTISQILTNNTDAVATLTYVVTPTSGTCGNGTFNVIVTVNPKPQVSNITTNICSGSAFSVTPSTALPNDIVPAGTSYTWGVPVSSPVGAVSGGTAQTGKATIGEVLTNNTNANATLTYTITPSTPDCTGPTFTVTVTVKSKPVIPDQSASICTGSSFSINLTNNPSTTILPSGTTYSWPAPVSNPLGIITGSSAQSAVTNISQTLTNATNASAILTYRISPLAGSCAGDSFSVDVTVKPVASIANETTTICSGNNFTITPSSGAPNVIPASTTYAWTNPVSNPAGAVTGGSAQTTQTSISQVLTNHSTGNGTLTYTVTPTSPGGCNGGPFIVTVNVNGKPEIPDTAIAICSNNSFTIAPVHNGTSMIIPSGTFYTWTTPVSSPLNAITGGSAQATGVASVSQTLTNTTNATATLIYTVTPVSGTTGNCAGAPFTITVTVNPQPGLSAQTATICSGTSFNVSPSGVPSNTTYSWSAPPTISPAGAITGGSAQSTATSNISQLLTNTTNSVATATYAVAPTAGSCGNSTFPVTVTVNPKPAIGNLSQTICSGDTFNITPVNGVPNAATIVPAGTVYTWNVPSLPTGVTGATSGTNQNSIIGTLVNNTTSVQAIDYTITPSTPDCGGNSFTLTITLKPKPVVSPKTDIICSGNSFSITPSPVPVGTTYTWGMPVSNPSSIIAGGNAQTTAVTTISQTLINNSNATASLSYMVSPLSGLCAGDSFAVLITVDPKPFASNYTDTICSGNSFAIDPQNAIPAGNIIPSGTSYTWGSPVSLPAGAVTGGTAQSTGASQIGQTLVNTTNASATLTYTVTPKSGTCGGNPFTVSVTVNPKPSIANFNYTTCSNSGFSVTPANTGGNIIPANTTYSWSSPTVTGVMTGGLPASGQTSINGILVNPTTSPQTATYTITPLSGVSGNCAGNSFTVTVTVNPQPGITNQVASICSGSSFNVAPANVPVTTLYSWSAPTIIPAGAIIGGSAQNNQATISETLVNQTNATAVATYTVTPSAAGCGSGSFTVTVTVHAKPVINAQAATICTNNNFLINPVNNAPAEIVPAGTSYSWNLPIANPSGSITGGSAGSVQTSISGNLINTGNAPALMNYLITPVSGTAGNCPGSPFNLIVTVNPDAKALFNPTDTISCPPFVITNTVAGLQTFPQANSNYQWYINGNLPGSGTIFPGYTIINDFDSVILKLKAISSYGCKNDSMSRKMYTYKLPHPAFTKSAASGCGPLTVNFVNTTPFATEFNYHWDFGNGQVSNLQNPPAIVFASNPTYGDTTYIVKLRGFNQCDTVEVQQSITVQSKPKALFTPNKTVGCSPMKVIFTNNSLGLNSTYSWDFGDGYSANQSTRDTISHIFIAGVRDTFYVKMIASNVCGSDSAVYSIIVSPNTIQLYMAVNGNEKNGCAPHTVRFINNSTGATGFQWTFGDGNSLSTTSNIDTITHTFLLPGTYHVLMNGVNGCSDTTMEQIINVFAKPVPSFTVNRNTACLGDTFYFSNNSVNATSYLWEFGDGNVSNAFNPSHIYPSPGLYRVVLHVFRLNAPGNVCDDSLVTQLRVLSSIPGYFTASDSLSNCAPFTVSFTNLNVPAVTSNWNFGDGNSGTGNVVTHTFNVAGIYNVVLTSQSPGGCTYVSNKTIKVLAPSGSFAYTGGFVCSARSVRFDVTASNTDSIRWVFGDGTQVTTVAPFIYHNYANPGIFLPKVFLVSNSGCAVPLTGTDSIKIERIIPGFTQSQNKFCGYTEVTFTDTSNVYFGNANVKWRFDDGQTGTGFIITHRYTSSKTYKVQLIVTGNSGCTDTIYRDVVVNVKSIPASSIGADSVSCTNLPVTFTANHMSIDPINFVQWSINGAPVSTNLVYSTVFANPGNFAIRLISGTINNCFDTVYQPLQINPSPVVIASSDLTICKGSTVPLHVTGAINYEWLPAVGLSCTICADPFAQPLVTTPYYVKGTNGFNCTSMDTLVVTVIQPLKMNVSPSDSICRGDSVKLLASGATSYQWSPNIALSSTTVANPVASPQTAVNYRVVGYDGFNCFTDTAFVLIGVGDYPKVSLGPDVILSTGTLLPLTSAIQNGPIRDWLWNPATNLNCNTCPLPVATVKHDITYDVTVTSFYGCSAKDTIQIKAFCVGTQVFIPNTFTPDGDGINDVFMVQGKGIGSVKTFRVFNRWGELVFEKNHFAPNDPAYGWDGKVNGIPAAPDVFVYTAEVLCDNGSSYVYKGNITLLK